MRWTWMPALVAAAVLAAAAPAHAQTVLNPPVITAPPDNAVVRTVHLEGMSDLVAHVVVTEGTDTVGSYDTLDGTWHLDVVTTDGPHTYMAHTELGPDRSADSAPVHLTVDTTAPAAPQIAEPADEALLKGPVVEVHGSAEPNATVDVYDGDDKLKTVTAEDGAWSVNLSLADGAHLLGAIATDAAGNASARSPAVHVTVDSVAPKTAIDSGPAGLTNAATASFAVSADDPSATFACELRLPDGSGALMPCDPHATYDLPADGAYTFTAVASDAAGNADPDPPTRTFTVDRTPPAAPALSGFAFSSEDGATFECRLDGGAYAACASPFSPAGLAPGAHTLLVRAIDRLGNVGAPASLAFTVAAPLPARPPSPTPAFHSAVVVRPTAGTVRVRRKGANSYMDLKAAQALPLGSSIDTKRGAVVLSSVPRKGAATQRATFNGGIFRVTQPAATTVLTLSEALTCGRKGRPKSRSLWGDGAGAFRIRGRYSSAAAGDRWVVRDTCSGTLTRVLQGLVAVRDDVRGKTVLVRAGKRYLARPGG